MNSMKKSNTYFSSSVFFALFLVAFGSITSVAAKLGHSHQKSVSIPSPSQSDAMWHNSTTKDFERPVGGITKSSSVTSKQTINKKREKDDKPFPCPFADCLSGFARRGDQNDHLFRRHFHEGTEKDGYILFPGDIKVLLVISYTNVCLKRAPINVPESLQCSCTTGEHMT